MSFFGCSVCAGIFAGNVVYNLTKNVTASVDTGITLLFVLGAIYIAIHPEKK
jgi:hypothetical protein